MLKKRKTLVVLKTHEVMEETILRNTADVAAPLHISDSLVRKWKQPPHTLGDEDQSGARNPLDRLEIVISTIEEIDPDRAYKPIKYLCDRFGFLPPVKKPRIEINDTELLKSILAYNKEFGETSVKIAEVLKDGRVSPHEFTEIYKEAMEDIEAIMGLLVVMKERSNS